MSHVASPAGPTTTITCYGLPVNGQPGGTR